MASLADLLARVGRRRRVTEHPDERLVLPGPPTAPDLLAAVGQVEALVRDGAVPAPVTSRVARVTKVVRETVPRLDRLGAGSTQAYSVMATATDYLPEAVGGYLRLPRDWANSRPVDGGRTSLMVLIDQLDLLARTMDQVFDAVCREDAAALVAHGRFLTEKFGSASGGGALDLSAPPAVPVAGDRAAGGAPGQASDGAPGRASDGAPGRLAPPEPAP
jgi:hypothetical protein